MWGLAALMAVGAGGITYLGVERRLQTRVPEAPLRPLTERPGAPAPPAERHVEGHAERAKSAEVRGEVAHVGAGAHASASGSCLNLRADVHAEVVIDDGVSLALPLEAFPVAAGPHKLMVVDSRGKYGPKRLDVTDEDTRCPGRALHVSFRHHERKD
jgi:hypothetical protein